MRFLTIVFLWMLLGYSSSTLLGQNWQIHKLTTEDGLPHNFGYDILEDKHGFLWIATDNGLARFDGRNFKHVQEEELGTKILVSLSAQRDSSLYVSTYKEGVYILKDIQLKKTALGETPQFHIHFMHPHIHWYKDEIFVFDQRKASNSALMAHYKEDIGKVVLIERIGNDLRERELTQRKTAVKYKMLRNFVHDPQLDIIHIDILTTASGIMYWATNNGLFEYLGDGKFQLIREGNFRHILESKRFGLILISNNEVWQWKDNRFNLLAELATDQIDGVALNEQGWLLWFEQASLHLNYLDLLSLQTGNFDSLISLKSQLSQIYADAHDRFWLTTHGEGIFAIQDTWVKNISIANTNQFYNVRAIASDNSGRIWLGTNLGLLSLDSSRLKVITDRFTWSNYFEGITIYDLENIGSSDQTHSLGVISARGSHVIDVEKAHIGMIAKGDIQAAYLKVKNHIGWVRNDSIVIRNYLDSTHRFTLSIPPAFYQQKKGSRTGGLIFRDTSEFWFGNGNTLMQYSKGNTNIYHIDKLVDNGQVKYISYDSEGRFWLLSNKGLFAFRDGQFIAHPQNAGLIDACDVLSFDRYGGIWIGGKKGIFHVQQTHLTKISTRYGLPINEVTSLYFDSQNRLWIGTIQGLSLIKNPHELQQENPPKLYIESFFVNDQVWERGLENVPSGSRLSLQLSIIDLHPQSQPHLQYRINEGDKWINTDNRTFDFVSLKSGSYQFQFRARNSNSPWSEPFTIPLVLDVPWWQRWESIVTIAMIFGLLVSLLFKQRVNMIQKRAAAQNELNQQMAHLQLSALQSQLNPHFMFNALNAIQYFILNRDEVTANDYLAKFSRLMRLFLEASHARYIPLVEEIELLELYIELEQLRFEGKFSYEIKLDPTIDPDEVEIPSMMLQPFVENAINHGLRHKKEIGELQISFRDEAKHILCVIEDDGIGREAAKKIRSTQHKKHKSRGMKLLEQRLDVLSKMEGAEIKVRYTDLLDNDGGAAGTKVEISLPYDS